MVTYGSLCTGYDGIGMALQIAGVPIEPLWMAEVEPAMSEVLKREHPHVPNVGDIKTAPWQLAPKTKLMSSGDPCQSISIAGRQLGKEDPRFLWPWVRASYREVRPAWIFFENVANIAGHDKGRTLAERHEHLREDGYAVRWTILGACAVGAPHHRHRYYALAAYVGPGAPEAVRLGTKQICGAPRSGGRFLLPTPVARDGDGRGEGDAEYWASRAARRGRSEGMPLGAAVALLPTPDASMSTRGGLCSPEVALRRVENVDRSSNLDDVVASLLPSPMMRDGISGPGITAGWQGSPDLRTVVTLLPTPLVQDVGIDTRPVPAGRTAEGPDYGARLKDVAVALMPTPRASDGENGRGNPGQVYGSGTLPLSGAVALLPTPTAGEAAGGHVEPEVGGTRPSGAKRMDSLGSVTALLPTPDASRAGSNRGREGDGNGLAVRPALGQVHELLPTPTTSNAHGNHVNGQGALLLPGVVARPEVWGKFAEAVALWEVITGVPAPVPTERGAKGAPRLSPLLPEWMMGLRPGLLTEHLGRADALKGAGNGVVPLAAAAAFRMLSET